MFTYFNIAKITFLNITSGFLIYKIIGFVSNIYFLYQILNVLQDLFFGGLYYKVPSRGHSDT